jgi:hypothetical protein
MIRKILILTNLLLVIFAMVVSLTPSDAQDGFPVTLPPHL